MEALGQQLLVELHGCEPATLREVDAVRQAVLAAARAGGATVIAEVFHHFSPFGVSGVVVIAESHVAIHTWPEHRYAAADVFTCGQTLHPGRVQQVLAERLGATQVSAVELRRGLLPGG